MLGAGFGISFVKGISPIVSIVVYGGAYLFGGFYTTKEAFEGISKGDFEIDFLMLVAAVGTAILGEWAEGALLLFLFSLGHSLEPYAMKKARNYCGFSSINTENSSIKKRQRIKSNKE